MRPGSDGDCPVQGLRSKTLGGGSALLGPAKAKAAWGAARGFFFSFFFFFTVATARRGAALARSSKPRAPWKLASQPPLPTYNLGPTSEAKRPPPLTPSLPSCPPLAGRPGPEPGNPGAGGGGQLRGGAPGASGILGPGSGSRGPGGEGREAGQDSSSPGGRLPARACYPARAVVASRPLLLALRWEAGQREARRSLTWAGGRPQLPIRGEARARLAPPAGCALYQG